MESPLYLNAECSKSPETANRYLTTIDQSDWVVSTAALLHGILCSYSFCDINHWCEYCGSHAYCIDHICNYSALHRPSLGDY